MDLTNHESVGDRRAHAQRSERGERVEAPIRVQPSAAFFSNPLNMESDIARLGRHISAVQVVDSLLAFDAERALE